MKTGRNISEIAQAILADRQAAKDYVANTAALQMVHTESDVALQFNLKGEQRTFKPTPLCLGQIADRVGVPAKYAERMREKAPGLLCQNVNHWFSAQPEQRMVRTINGNANIARAFLSGRYRPLDNADLFAAVMPKLLAAGCEVRSAEITETRLYIQASTPRIQAVIDQNVVIGTHNRIQRTVEAGVIIGNSEVGCGSIFVEPMMYDLVCTNGLVLQRTLKRHHVGRRQEGSLLGDDTTFEMFSDETRKLDDAAFWSKVADVTTASLDEIKFNENIERLRDTQKDELAKDATDMPKVVEAVTERFQLADAEKDNLLLHFAQGGDFSRYGLINAMTRMASDVASYDRAVELERVGGQIIDLTGKEILN